MGKRVAVCNDDTAIDVSIVPDSPKSEPTPLPPTPLGATPGPPPDAVPTAVSEPPPDATPELKPGAARLFTAVPVLISVDENAGDADVHTLVPVLVDTSGTNALRT